MLAVWIKLRLGIKSDFKKIIVEMGGVYDFVTVVTWDDRPVVDCSGNIAPYRHTASPGTNRSNVVSHQNPKYCLVLLQCL
jgi:hypothetical protein